MTKRRNRSKSPNLPQSTLERAQKQAAGEEVNEVDSYNEVEASASKAKTTNGESEKARRRRRSTTAAVQKDTVNPKRKGGPDAKTIALLLANPTKVVTEEQLHAEYSYVLNDLRSMGLLSVALLVLLFILSRFI